MASALAVHFKSESVEWRTPGALYKKLNEEFDFTYDPCPLGGNEDGLARLFSSWAQQRVFCNPPYGPGIRDWLERGFEAEIAVFLLPARTDVNWFHEVVLPHAKEIRFIRGRLKFGEAVHAAPFPSMIVIFERNDG
jgi:site-specific DNA-methyltransferase (adenine-specific)